MDKKIVLKKDKEKSLDKDFEESLLKQVFGERPKKESEFIETDGFFLLITLGIILVYFIFQAVNV